MSPVRAKVSVSFFAFAGVVVSAMLAALVVLSDGMDGASACWAHAEKGSAPRYSNGRNDFVFMCGDLSCFHKVSGFSQTFAKILNNFSVFFHIFTNLKTNGGKMP